MELGIELTRKGGKVCVVGVNGSTKPTKFPSDFFVLNDLTLVGVSNCHSFRIVKKKKKK